MSDQGIWFKLWCAADDDPELSILSVADYGRWCKLGSYTKKYGDDGTVVITEPPEGIVHPLQAKFQTSCFSETIACISRFKTCVISNVPSETNATVSFKIEWRNWRKYQGDLSTSRVRLHRDKKRRNETPKKRREENKESTKKKPPTADADLVFSGQALKVEAAVHEKLIVVYDPRLAAAEYPKADLWLQNNPQRKRSNVARFMASWLERAARSAPRGGGETRVGPNYF